MARATWQGKGVSGIWVPATAVLDLGSQQVVFVREEAPNAFRPVRVQIGAKANGYVAIKNGIGLDQVVAQNAQFLIDSESFVNVATTKQ